MSKSKFQLTPALRAVIAESSRRIFGHLPVVTHRTGNKLFQKKPIGPILADYYLPDLTRQFKQAAPDYESAIAQRRRFALERMRREGNGPPKKGQGKRSSKGKKKE